MICKFCNRDTPANKEDIYNPERTERMCLDCRIQAALITAKQNKHNVAVYIGPDPNKGDDTCILAPDYICRNCDAQFSTGQTEGTFFGGRLLESECAIRSKQV